MACGSDEQESGDRWRIGLEAPLSGDQATLGKGMLQGAQLAADEINADGGILGKKVDVIPIDDAADPKTGVTAAKEAISNGLDGLVGPYNSGVGVETLPLYIDADVVPIRLTSDNATDGQGFTLQPMSDQIAPVTSKALEEYYGASSVGILYDSTQVYTKSVSAAVRKQLESAGIEVTDYLPVKPGASSYSSEIAEIAAKGPDVIYAAVYYPEGAKVARDLSTDASYSGKCLLDYASYDNGYIEDAASSAAECLVVGVPSPGDFQGSGTYVSKFEDKFGSQPGTWSPYTYDSLNFLIDGVEQVGKFDYQQLTDYLKTVSGWKGWTGSVTIDPATGNRDPATVVVTTVSGGQFSVDRDWATAVGAPY